MRRAGAKFLSAVLASGLALSACAAQQIDSDYHSLPPPKPGWFSGWFGWGKSSPPPAPLPEPKKPVVVEGDPGPQPPRVDPRAGERDREEKAMYRRLAVCDRLMDVALRNEDRALQRQVEEMTERVTTLYRRRMERLGATPPGAAADEAALERHLGDGGNGGALQPPARGGADGRAANTRGDNR